MTLRYRSTIRPEWVLKHRIVSVSEKDGARQLVTTRGLRLILTPHAEVVNVTWRPALIGRMAVIR